MTVWRRSSIPINDRIAQAFQPTKNASHFYPSIRLFAVCRLQYYTLCRAAAPRCAVLCINERRVQQGIRRTPATHIHYAMCTDTQHTVDSMVDFSSSRQMHVVEVFSGGKEVNNRTMLQCSDVPLNNSNCIPKSGYILNGHTPTVKMKGSETTANE